METMTRLRLLTLALPLAFSLSCDIAADGSVEQQTDVHRVDSVDQKAISGESELAHATNPEGMSIAQRFDCPKGYSRSVVAEGTFSEYLRSLPLKPHDSAVHYYDGREKANRMIYAAVVDMELDAQDLQQCADAVMRLRGEYLFGAEKYDSLQFNFLSDGKPRRYLEYAKGDFSYSRFRKYMRYIFSYANTASLRDELQPRPMMEMSIGDVLIQKGRPYGHAVIVMDMCENEGGQRLYMLGQSYMPAQDTQILYKASAMGQTVWYRLEEGTIATPEWQFDSEDLRHF